MPDLPKKKVGIVACSGEELPEGTVTRLAALKVLEQLRPADTVTICLPLFLAGGEGDRAFARFYPTIAVDGCDKRCAAQATEMHSGKPAASIVVSDLVTQYSLGKPEGSRKLNDSGMQAVEVTAAHMAELVDSLLVKGRSGRSKSIVETQLPVKPAVSDEPVQAACSCGSGIPVQEIIIEGQTASIIALPLIFQQFREADKAADEQTARELLDTVRIYNDVAVEAQDIYIAALLREYRAFCDQKETIS